jgi:outer membrane protein assembly factor BamB
MTRALSLTVITLALLSPARAEDWPGFRGPTGQGVSAETDLPLRWSATENVAWKTPIPGESWSSPVVQGGRVFVTMATNKGESCHVLCLDRKNGSVLWDREVFRQQPTRKEGNNSYATPTPAADGERIYAAFNDGSLVALDYNGVVAWTYRDVKFYSQHGLGASPRLTGGLVVMPYDGSSSGEDKKVGWQKPWDRAFLLALDARTGQVRWKASRGLSRIGHATPVATAVGGRQVLLSNAGDVVQAFDQATGERLWSVPSEGEGVVTSIVIGEGLAFAASGFPHKVLRAVRLSEPAIAWEHKASVPSIPSPVYAKPHLFTIADNGVAQCLEAATGKVVWQERVGGKHSASPLLGAGRIYFLAENGEATVIEAGGAFKVLARNPVGETCKASLAASDGQLFLRTDKHVYCLGRRP